VTTFANVRDPSLAWKVPMGPAWLYWSTTAIVVVGGTVLSVFCAQYLMHEHEEVTTTRRASRASPIVTRSEWPPGPRACW